MKASESRFKTFGVIAATYVVGALLYMLLAESERSFPPEAKPAEGALIENRLVGESIRIVQSEHLENGWSSKIEVSLDPQGSVPFSHVHRGYTETFSVIEGSLRVEVDGVITRVDAGQSFVVEPGVSHVPANPYNKRAVFQVEVRGVPNFTSCLSQIHRRLGDKSASWFMRHVRVGRLANICDIYVSAIPWWFQAAGMVMSAPILEVLGFPVFEPMVNVRPKESNDE